MSRVLRPGGMIGTITWGDDPAFAATEVFEEELERYGAEAAEALSFHELVDSQPKMRSLLERSGFETIETWPGRYERRLELEEFLAIRSNLGPSGRRLKSLDERSRSSCIDAARERLMQLSAEDYIHRAEIIYARATRSL